MSSWIAVGQMSGTSLDGVDWAAVRFYRTNSQWQFELLRAETDSYSPQWEARLNSAPKATAEVLAKLHVDYGHYLGLLLRRFILSLGISPDVVSLHGHTVFHQPAKQFTCQIGCGETVASYASVPVVTNFRARDVALGGQGAPLVPMGESALFPQTGIFLNLGGIANLSLFRDRLPEPLPADTTWQKPGWTYLAYDIGGCNLVLNSLSRQSIPSQPYDPEGRMAQSGQVVPSLLEQLRGVPFYHLTPPRSLGIEALQTEVFPILDASSAMPTDKLHTWCIHLAEQLAKELTRLGVHSAEILITGGGAHNTFLRSCLEMTLRPLGIELGAVPREWVDFKEAIVFSFLGLLRLLGEPTVLPGTTGSRRISSTGSLHLPESWAVRKDI